MHESHPHSTPASADQPGEQITELCAVIYAATYRSPVLIRGFDVQGALVVKALEMAMEIETTTNF